MNVFPESPYTIYIGTRSGSCALEFVPTEWHIPADAKLSGHEVAIGELRSHFDQYPLGMWGYPIERLEFCSPMDIHANLTANQTCYQDPLIRASQIIGYVPDELPVEIHPDNSDPAEEDEAVLEAALDDAIHQDAATSPHNDLSEPTPAQKEAGNYKKAHITIQGLEIAVENPAGSERSGVDRDGNSWTLKLHHHYGYIKGTKGRDKDHLDVFLGPDPENAEKVFIVNQINPESTVFDEHKIMLGFASKQEARDAYLSNYADGWQGIGSICTLFMDEFKDWLEKGDTTIAVERGAVGSYRQDPTWVGIDLDGTLARYDGWKDDNHIGEPVPLMMAFVKHLIEEGRAVKIFTARASDPEKIKPVELWLEEHGLGGLEVTNAKDHNMTMLYDDRAAKVIANTGVILEKARESAIMERGEGANFRDAVQVAISFDDIETVFADMFGPIVVKKFIFGEISELENKIKAMREKLAQVEPDQDGAGTVKGEKTTAYLNDNSPIEMQYAVIEVGRLVTSHSDEMSLNKDFSQDLQPRDRSRSGMKLQVEQMAGKLNPERLGESTSVTTGAPIIGQDLTVESGNGRTIAIRKAYAMGDKGQEYKQWLISSAGQFGISAKSIESMDRPVLVRIRLTEIDRSEFARKANEDEIAQMAPAELARADAAKLTEDDIALFQPSEDGGIAAPGNRAFITRFFERLGANAATGYMTKDGGYTKQLVDRVQAAIFQKAYQDDALVALMAEEADPKIKNILNAMTIAAGEFSKAKAIDAGFMGIDIPRHVIEAAKLIKKAREDHMTIEESLAQGNLFEEIPEDTREIALFIAQNIRSAKRMGAVLKESARLLRHILIDEKEPRLMDVGEASRTPSQIIALAIEKERATREGGRNLFEDASNYDWRMAINGAVSFDEIFSVFERVFPATIKKMTKEPWELTIAEFWARNPDILSEPQAYAMHFTDVYDAIKAGKFVPADVLNDYPEIIQKLKDDQDQTPPRSRHAYGDRYGKAAIETDDGETTVSKMLSRILKAAPAKKDKLYLSVSRNDREYLLNEMILRLPDGAYTIGRTGNNIRKSIDERLGTFAEIDVTERLLRGLSVEFPQSVKVAFTLGLDEVILTNSYKGDSK